MCVDCTGLLSDDIAVIITVYLAWNMHYDFVRVLYIWEVT